MQALSVGIFPYVLKLLQTTTPELRQILVFIWTKILALDKVNIEYFSIISYFELFNISSHQFPESVILWETLSFCIALVRSSEMTTYTSKQNLDMRVLAVLSGRSCEGWRACILH